MKKIVRVQTDAPDKRSLNLVVTGSIEKIVEITPASLYLEGRVGEPVQSVVKIAPSPKYPFSILEMKQQYHTGIKMELVKPSDIQPAWQIRVNALSEKAANLYDVVVLKTDSPYRPTLSVRVYAVFSAPKTKPADSKS